MSAPKLDIKVLKWILSLNTNFTEEHLTIWLMIDEIYQCLTDGGVGRTVTIKQMKYAIEQVNRSSTFV